jgi:hypothetical protein
MLLASFPPDDKHSLWKNFSTNKYRNPNWGGVHGSSWAPPLVSPGNGGFKIASPVPKAKVNKIIAKDLPAHTLSASSFDLPKRKDVVQITLPTSRLKTVQYVIDPTKNFKPIKTGTYYHGIEQKIQKKSFGLFRFMSPDQINTVKNDALTAAQTAENKAAQLTGQISKNPLATSMIIPIVTTNLQEQPSLKIAYKNSALAARKKALKNSKAGLKK